VLSFDGPNKIFVDKASKKEYNIYKTVELCLIFKENIAEVKFNARVG
jgi:hypothetical protein